MKEIKKDEEKIQVSFSKRKTANQIKKIAKESQIKILSGLPSNGAQQWIFGMLSYE